MLPHSNSPQYLEHLKLLPLIHASEFCQIATNIQDRLVESPLLSSAETAAYDADIIKWHDELPPILSQTSESCPDFLHRVRLVMKWRFQNLRLVLHRPALLVSALRRCPFDNLSAEEKIAVRKCRIIAAKTIEDISDECLPDLISGWNAVWFTFQACMVPLVSLFSDTSVPEETEKWCASIELALAFFDRSKPWSIAAKRSLDAVSRLYQAYKMQPAAAHFALQPPSLPAAQQQLPNVSSQYAAAAADMQGMAAFSYSHQQVPDLSAFAMHPGAVGSWPADPNHTANINGFWDDMYARPRTVRSSV